MHLWCESKKKICCSWRTERPQQECSTDKNKKEDPDSQTRRTVFYPFLKEKKSDSLLVWILSCFCVVICVSRSPSLTLIYHPSSPFTSLTPPPLSSSSLLLSLSLRWRSILRKANPSFSPPTGNQSALLQTCCEKASGGSRLTGTSLPDRHLISSYCTCHPDTRADLNKGKC